MNTPLTKYILVLVLVCSLVVAKGQQCEWVDLFGGSGNDYNLTHTVDDSNNVVAVGRYTSTITRGSTSFYLSSGLNEALVKYKPDGTVIWMTRMKGLDTTKFSSVNVNTITSLNNEYYVVGSTGGNIDFGNGITLQGTPGTSYIFLIKYNTNGVAQWVRPFYSLYSVSTYWGGLDIDNSGNIFLTFAAAGTWIFSSSDTVSTGNPSQVDIFLVKFSNTGNFIWGKHYGSGSLTKHDVSRSISIDGSNNIYLGGGTDSLIPFGSQMIWGKGFVVLKLDTAGNPIRGISLPYDNIVFGVNAGIAAFPDGRLAFTGFLQDSMDFGNSVKLYSKGTSNVNVVFALFDSSLNCKWAKQEEPLTGSLTVYAGIKISNNNIYTGGSVSGQTILGNATVGKNGAYSFCVIKMDTIGSFLWAFASETNGIVLTIGPDKEGNTYVGGGVSDSIELFGVKKYSNGQFSDIFLAKLKDYKITRGNVYPGPYCAGDSILIPYTSEGRFDAGNEFIAELSDSAGNFDYSGRELGRITDTLSGVIKGVLPLFNVATNNRYRIRILSTKPVVQSFYKQDTLRLLIYSKDTANAGPDLLICKGQPVRLGTTGGSRWLWSPPTFMPDLKDTGNRQPLVKPDSAIEYRIIISDSSGCGEIDTDYVKVFIRPPLTSQIIGSSVSCRGQKVQLRANIRGGYSTGYWYMWIENTALIGSKDTITVSPRNTTTYKIIVGDSCNPKPDTLFFTLQIDTILKVLTSRDTTICKGAKAYLDAWGTGCDPSQYDFTWAVFGGNTVLSNSSHFEPSPSTTTMYRVTLRDKSSSYFNARNVKVTVDNVFKATLLKDTTICKGQSVNLLAGAISCDTSLLRFAWNNGLDTLQNHTVSPTATTTYTVVVTNANNGLKDTASVTITVRPPLGVTVNPDTAICMGQTAELRATAIGGNASSYSIVWTTDNSAWTNTSFKTTVSPAGTTTYRVVLYDNCSLANDTAYIKVTVSDSLKILPPYTDTAICTGESITLHAAAKGGNTSGYKFTWRLPDNTVVNGPQLNTVPASSGAYKVKISDNCTQATDSASIFVFVRKPLQTNVTGNTQACAGDTITLTANVTGGDSSNYTYRWTFPDGSTGTTKTIKVSPAITAQYKVIAGDNCSTPAFDSSLHSIVVPLPITIAPSPDTSVCFGRSIGLSITISGGTPSKYKIIWQDINSSYTATTASITVKPTATTQYKITVTDGCALQAVDTVLVAVLPTPVANFDITNKTGCVPLTVTAVDLSQNHDPVLNVWQIAGVDKEETAPIITITQSGAYNAALVVSNALGCRDSMIKYGFITTYPLPSANFTYYPEHAVIESPVTFYNYSANARYYNWFWTETDSTIKHNDGDQNKMFTDTGWQTVKLVAINAYDCTDTTLRKLYVHDIFTSVIPNAFTPNGDGLNDVFSLVNTGDLSYTMSIFNRWGERLYYCEFEQNKTPQCAWDGTYNGVPVTDGMYFYLIGFESETHLKRNVWGTLNMMR